MLRDANTQTKTSVFGSDVNFGTDVPDRPALSEPNRLQCLRRMINPPRKTNPLKHQGHVWSNRHTERPPNALRAAMDTCSASILISNRKSGLISNSAEDLAGLLAHQKATSRCAVLPKLAYRPPRDLASTTAMRWLFCKHRTKSLCRTVCKLCTALLASFYDPILHVASGRIQKDALP